MTWELTKVELTNGTGNPLQYTCASGTAITKGTLLKLTDPRTAIANDTSGAVIAGIASADKSATDDTSTSIAVWTDGIFKGYASGAIEVGAPLIGNAYNHLNSAGLTGNVAIASGAAIIGYALETAADGETFMFRLKL